MSRYATWQNCVQRYPALSKSTGSVDDDFEEAFIVPAEDEVDARLASRYTVPFTGTIPGMVKSLTIDIAYYKKTIAQKESVRIGEYIDKMFAAILAGQINIDTSQSSTPNAASLDAEYHTRFGEDDPTNWRPDSDALVDNASDRDDD